MCDEIRLAAKLAMESGRIVENELGKWLVRDNKPQDLEPLRPYESVITDILRALCSNNHVFVDVGANVGKYTVLAARLCGKVYAVEPDPDNLVALVANIMLNNAAGRVMVICKALGAKPGTARLSQSGAQSRITSSDEGGTIVVDVTTLDECCPDADIVKIAVEGYELEVIRGALRIIESRRPVLLIEHHDYIFGNKPSTHPEIARILMERGYLALRVRYPHFLYVHRDRLIDVEDAVRIAVGIHMLHEKIVPNIRQGLPWYYGLEGTWWYGMDIPEYVQHAGRYMELDEIRKIMEDEIQRAARGEVTVY